MRLVPGVPAVLLVGVLTGGLTACGGSDDEPAAGWTGQPSPGSASASASASPGATTGASPTSPGPADPAPTGTSPQRDPAGPTAPAAVLAQLRTANRGSYDRVVLQFDRPFGGWSVQYVDQVVEDPTGDPVDLAGGAALLVVVQGATLDNFFQVGDGVPAARYPGPRRLSPGLPAVREVADAGDFEAVLSVGIGTTGRTGFRVFRLTGPDRLVVDVAH